MTIAAAPYLTASHTSRIRAAVQAIADAGDDRAALRGLYLDAIGLEACDAEGEDDSATPDEARAALYALMRHECIACGVCCACVGIPCA